MDRIENAAFNSSYVVTFVFVAAGTCLLSRCLAAAASSGSAVVKGAYREEGDLISLLLIS
jgi:hypothetical protein